MLSLDHAKLIRGDLRELAALRSWLMAGQPVSCAVRHQPDWSCCAREQWDTTLARIVAAVRPPALRELTETWLVDLTLTESGRG